ncbi:hypothetical protein RI367_006478 [Sorochytrium milnesiophthora]
MGKNKDKAAQDQRELALAASLFSELARELENDRKLVGNLQALFGIKVTRKGERKGEWHAFSSFLSSMSKALLTLHGLCRGQEATSQVSTSQPPTELTKGMPVVIIEIDQRDLFNFFSGGLNGYKAITSGRVRIAGDLLVAQKLEEVFRKAGGVEKTMAYLKQHSDSGLLSSKL